MNAPAPSPPPTRHAPIALWRVAQAFMHTLYNLFGAPEDVAFAHTLTTNPYQLMLSWIRCAEAMLRRLLLIEASAYAGAVPKPNAPRPKRHRARKRHAFTHDKPEAWRVSFRCFHLPPRRGGSAEQREAKGDVSRAPSDAYGVSSPASGGDKNRFHNAWPLAERYEAILRVYNNPEPYARRLAARLRANAPRIKEVLRAPPEAEHRIDCWEALTHGAEVRWPRAADTS
jgi:hypothetical protein